MGILKLLTPKLSIWVLALLMPIGLGIYFYSTQYAGSYVAQNQIGYTQLDQNPLTSLLVNSQIAAFTDRASDFILWGVLAAIALVLHWVYSAARVTLSNHKSVEEFRNFRVSRASWHGHLATEVALRILVVFLILFALSQLFFSYIPKLSVATGYLTESIDASTMLRLAVAFGLVYGAQLVIATLVKIFRSIEVD